MNPEDRPWGPLTFALLLLFASLGGNFYLSWLAWDFYIRFRTLLVETSSTSAA